MTGSLPIRALTVADLPACAALSRVVGWPWEEPKWRLLVSLGDGLAMDAPDGTLSARVGGRRGER